jgi:hypothetical protein
MLDGVPVEPDLDGPATPLVERFVNERVEVRHVYWSDSA